MTPYACLRCGRGPLRPRSRPDLPGVPHAGRGLCRSCYQSPATVLDEHPHIGRGGITTGRPCAHVAEDVSDLDGKRAATRVGYTIESRRSVALRLGVSLAALDRALYRERDQRDVAA